MNIYKFELSNLKKSILIWGLSVPGFLIFYMAFFPAMASSDGAFMDIMSGMDERFLRAMGIIPELPIGQIMGYFNLTIGFVMLPLAIQASNYGFSILSVEERELTADFLFSKPISRSKILISKFLAALTSLLIIDLIVSATTFLSFALFKGSELVQYNKIIVLLLSLPLFQLTFMSIGMVISVSVKKVSSVLSFSMGLGFGMFIISSLGGAISSGFLLYLTPFKHFDSSYVLMNGSWNWGLLIISLLAMIGSLVASYFLYLKRNIASL